MNITDEYLLYLMDMVGADSERSLLCLTLYNIPFRWDHHFLTDGNRADDGLYLRIRYYHDTGKVAKMEGPARVLEVLVALAVRIDFDIMGEPGVYNAGKWFDIMLENLGINYMTNHYFDKGEVMKKVGRWLDREYDRHGDGSLFPLCKTKYDQRHITIWDQANEYLVENY